MMQDIRIGEKQRYPFVTAVHWFAFNPQGELLLLRRFGTGYMDGSYSVPAGHVDGGESARAAMLREIYEEVGVELTEGDITFGHVMHRNQVSEPHERIDFFYVTKDFSQPINNCEPDKCDELRWVDPSNPPQNMVEYVRKALRHVTEEVFYSEHTEE